MASIRRSIRTNHALTRFQSGAQSLRDSTGEHVMERALYSIEETRARLGGISRSSLYVMLRAGDLPSVVIGCQQRATIEMQATANRSAQDINQLGETGKNTPA